MNIRPLTGEQQRFAEENHHLVYVFLNKRNLPESVFYDIVIFGYLRAVQEYCEVPSLHRFKFSTMAWKRMRSSLSNYYQYLSRPKRCAPTVSLDSLIGNEDELYWEDIISRPDESMIRLETELLLHAPLYNAYHSHENTGRPNARHCKSGTDDLSRYQHSAQRQLYDRNRCIAGK